MGILIDEEEKCLVPKAPCVPTIYYLPKIHKNAEKLPGRPIVSGIDSVISRVGEEIDYFLEAIVTKNESYFKDSGELIKILNSNTYNSYLVTVDVNSL